MEAKLKLILVIQKATNKILKEYIRQLEAENQTLKSELAVYVGITAQGLKPN